MTGQIVESQELTKEDAIKRIEDWKNRLSKLYTDVEEWITDFGTYTTERIKDVRMYEEFMHRFSLQAELLESLDIRKETELVATLRPVGLWIIGANGRVDILLYSGSVFLVDQAEQFTPSNWVAYSKENNMNGERFTKATFQRLLRDHT